LVDIVRLNDEEEFIIGTNDFKKFGFYILGLEKVDEILTYDHVKDIPDNFVVELGLQYVSA